MSRRITSHTIRTVLLALPLAFASVVRDSAAQTAPVAAPSRASVSVAGGAAGGGSLGSGLALGGSATIDLTDRLALDGAGTYLRQGPGADGLSLEVALRVALVSPSRPAVPYVAIGAGVYRASFDLGQRRFFGMMNAGYAAGTQLVPLQGTTCYSTMCYGVMGGAYAGPAGWMGHRWDVDTQGPWPGPTVTPGEMPMFYARRLGTLTVPQGGMWGTRAFTDPALTLGGGMELNLSRHLSLRPDARGLIVVADGETYTVGVFSFHVGYRF